MKSGYLCRLTVSAKKFCEYFLIISLLERVTLLEKEQPELRDLMRNQNYILELKINETNLEIASVELNLSSRIKMLREDWKATDNVLKEARSQIDHLEKQDFGAQIQKEKDRVSVLSNSVDEIELSFKTEVSILHHNISKTVEYLNDLSEDLNAKSNDLRQAESQINQLKNADFGDQIEKEKERISILSNNVDKIERSLKSDISDLQFNLSDTRGDLSELSTLHTVTELRLEAAEDKVKALEDADFEGQIIIEKDRITAIDTRLDRHDSEISGVKADVVDLVSDIHGVENDLGSLRSRVATVEGKVSVLQSANYGSQISILQSTVNGLRGCCQSPVIPDSPPSPTPSPADDSVDRCGEINPYGLPYPC